MSLDCRDAWTAGQISSQLHPGLGFVRVVKRETPQSKEVLGSSCLGSPDSELIPDRRFG